MKGYRIAGACMIVLGLLALAGQIVGQRDWFGYAFLLTVGAGFIAAYVQGKQLGFLIPGTILVALGVAVYTTEHLVSEPYSGPLVLGLLGLAFLVIYLLGTRPNIWPLYPAFSLWLIAALALTVQGERLGRIVFPVLLILLGVWWLWAPGRKSTGD